MAQEVLVPPPQTAFQKVQELYGGLKEEAQPFDDITVEKVIDLEGGSRIKIATIIGGMPNDRVLVSIVNPKKGINVQHIISLDGTRDEERTMSNFVDWAKESIDKRTVVEPPYELKNVPV